MKTLSGFDFRWLARLIDWLTRGEVPIDGLEVPKDRPVPRQKPEPVRWGNFR